MAFTADDVRTNQEYFAHKLRAEKQRNDVLKAVEGDQFDFILIDTRGAEAFAAGHIPGSRSIPNSELDRAASSLPKDREYVTYCWSHD